MADNLKAGGIRQIALPPVMRDALRRAAKRIAKAELKLQRANEERSQLLALISTFYQTQDIDEVAGYVVVMEAAGDQRA